MKMRPPPGQARIHTECALAALLLTFTSSCHSLDPIGHRSDRNHHALTTLTSVYDVEQDNSRLVNDVRSYYQLLDAQALKHCDPQVTWASPGCVYVMDDDSILYHKDAQTVKQIYADIMLHAILRGMQQQNVRRNISFYLDLRASGPRLKKKDLRRPRPLAVPTYHAPLFAIAYKGGNFVARPSALIPSPYFLDPKWWQNFTEEALAVASQRPWRQRKRAALFRGACGPGGVERLRLAALEESPLLDVGIVGFIGSYRSVKHCIHTVNNESLHAPPHEMQRIFGRIKPKLAMLDYSNYRYLLHMPGAATGSYSRNLQHLFMHGSIVLFWRCDAKEWYYPLLKDRVHVVYCNASTIEAVITEIEENEVLRETLLAGSEYVARHFFSAATIRRRWNELLTPLGPRQRISPLELPREACSCDDSSYTANRCQFCEELTYHYLRFRPEARRPGAWI